VYKNTLKKMTNEISTSTEKHFDGKSTELSNWMIEMRTDLGKLTGERVPNNFNWSLTPADNPPSIFCCIDNITEFSIELTLKSSLKYQ
jgi:hypothetical protein